jgi:glucokinase
MYVGIDIGGTKTLVATATSKYTLKTSQKILTPADALKALDEISIMIEAQAGNKISAIGISAPGPLDRHKGRILNPPNLPWRNVSLTDHLHKRFGVPVALENDANAAALAEYTLGAGRGYNPVLYVTISTGVGTGLISDGHIYHGRYDTEGGHIMLQTNGPLCGCGGHGHFEAISSGTAIKRRYGKFGYEIKDKPTWKLIARDMAQGLVSLAAVTSPEAIILGGGVSVHWERFKDPLEEYFHQFWAHMYPPPVIKPAHHIETAAIFGAFLVAKQAAQKTEKA